jgi:hypothetical protein
MTRCKAANSKKLPQNKRNWVDLLPGQVASRSEDESLIKNGINHGFYSMVSSEFFEFLKQTFETALKVCLRCPGSQMHRKAKRDFVHTGSAKTGRYFDPGSCDLDTCSENCSKPVLASAHLI